MNTRSLYRINPSLDKIEKHELTEDCLPQLVERYPNYGDLYRCKVGGYHDHYGYLKRIEAKKEAVQLIKQEIIRLNQLLKEMGE